MNFKLFTVSSMYPGYLRSFYSRVKGIENLSYDELYKLLLNDTTEFIGSYTKTFRKLGISADCAIANDTILQNKWRSENILSADKDILNEQVKKNQPDVLWIDNLSFTDKEWLQNIRNDVKSIKLIIAYHCSPFSPKITERLKYVDFLITCTPGLKQEMENNGIRTFLVYHAFDTDLTSRIKFNNNSPENHLIFSGSLTAGADFHGDRIELVESLLKEDIGLELYVNLENKYKIKAKQAIYSINELLNKVRIQNLKKHIPILQYGSKPVRNYSDLLLKKNLPSLYGIDMYNLFSNSRIVLNMHIGVAGNFAGNMRLFEVTGVGSCLLTDNKKNLSDLFDINSEIVVYDNPQDCIEKSKWLLRNDTERKKIADAGNKKTLAHHTVENRCKLILEIIEQELFERGKKNKE